jgi:hypothetical protein
MDEKEVIEMNTFLTILAILSAPLVALQVSMWLDKEREAKKRKMDIFGTLMATRATGMNPQHVEALNRIDEKDSGKKEKLDAEWKAWTLKKEDLLTDLLYEMAQYFGYEFDKVHIKRGHYIPKLYGDIEMELMIIRKSLVKIFEHKAFFPIFALVAEAPAPNELKPMLDKMQEETKTNTRKK